MRNLKEKMLSLSKSKSVRVLSIISIIISLVVISIYIIGKQNVLISDLKHENIGMKIQFLNLNRENLMMKVQCADLALNLKRCKISYDYPPSNIFRIYKEMEIFEKIKFK